MYTEHRTVQVAAAPDAVWRVVSSVGGDNGWYAADLGWRARAVADRVVGGPGMRTGRPEGEPRRGDEVDFWRVEDVRPGRSLRLRAEMRLPGTAWLTLAVAPIGGTRSVLTQVTEFEPAGLPGHAYWWAQWPAHQVVFRAMVQSMARAAERTS